MKRYTQFVVQQPQITQATTNAIHSLGIFVKELFSIIDRSYVIEIVSDFVKEVSSSTQTSEPLSNYIYDFFIILFDHEHIVPLNLPLLKPLPQVKYVTEKLM